MKNISIVDYEEKHAAAAVKMWRLSNEKSLGMKDELHTFEGHLNFVTQHLARTDKIHLAIEAGPDTVSKSLLKVIAITKKNCQRLCTD